MIGGGGDFLELDHGALCRIEYHVSTGHRRFRAHTQTSALHNTQHTTPFTTPTRRYSNFQQHVSLQLITALALYLPDAKRMYALSTNTTTTTTASGVGFGTAALGAACYDVVTMALEAGFRKFDTAEADWWYDQKAVGNALQDFFVKETARSDSHQECSSSQSMECANANNAYACACDNNLQISTKIPPWSLTSEEHIRTSAASSRQELLGFCDDPSTSIMMMHDDDDDAAALLFPLDVYYIHAPTCWKGWHPRCDDHPPLLDLRSSWLAMEAVVGIDHSARRIGLSNIRPDELLDIIQFVQSRQQQQQQQQESPSSSSLSSSSSSSEGVVAPPRKPDVVQAYADPIKPAEELRRICQEHGIEFVSYSTLGTQHRGVNGNPVLGSSIVMGIANKHARSTAEVVLSWALQHGMSVIPRSSKKHHIEELARLLPGNNSNATFLDADDLAQIDAMKYTL